MPGLELPVVPVVGSKLQALDWAGHWYDAAVVGERGEGAAHELLIHYKGWKSRFDEWVGARSGRVRAAGELGACPAVAASASLVEGSQVEVQHATSGAWFEASVLAERGDKPVLRELLVHYRGWNSRYGARRARSNTGPAPSPRPAH